MIKGFPQWRKPYPYSKAPISIATPYGPVKRKAKNIRRKLSPVIQSKKPSLTKGSIHVNFHCIKAKNLTKLMEYKYLNGTKHKKPPSVLLNREISKKLSCLTI